MSTQYKEKANVIAALTSMAQVRHIYTPKCVTGVKREVCLRCWARCSCLSRITSTVIKLFLQQV